MKRLTFGAVAAGLLAFAAVAFAGGKLYTGHASNTHCGQIPSLTCAVKLNGKLESGKVTKVVNFSYEGLPTECPPNSGAGTTIKSPYLAPMKVGPQRKFSGTFNFDTQSVHITGQFTKNYMIATGTLKVHGEVPNRGVCDTGLDNYSVHRVAN